MWKGEFFFKNFEGSEKAQKAEILVYFMNSHYELQFKSNKLCFGPQTSKINDKTIAQ